MLAIELETDLIQDAARELLRIQDALVLRHGDEFRALERALDALPDGPMPEPGVHAMPPDESGQVFIVGLPPTWSAILEEAKRLGV